MFQNLTFEQRLIGVNSLLFIVIATFAILMVGEERTITAPPPTAEIESIIEGNTSETDVASNQQDPAPMFGEAPIFDTLIVLPTPSPTPAPTAPPDPPLVEAIKSWKIVGIDSGVVFVQDARTRQDFLMDIDDEDTSQLVRHRGTDMKVILKDVDDIYFTATFIYRGPQGDQEHKIGMFDQ